ncbi:urea ABC transporter permease subunit UrtB [Phragmitibacter flavus]|uniref:Urea ABC transporter permease subunit UrtB n=1 Tax=Phragmitibacter flavus TaxID=2576071 RepID=A0A5R8KF95_9BACT|nr:urea ABC transporter permease subunit UrtB [Phragmitibacter flavus]TLD70937.1 urea ABC transporter permease subunit UrtB [Phragmitibacter flavus]
MKLSAVALSCLLFLAHALTTAQGQAPARQIINDAIVEEDQAKKRDLIGSLSLQADDTIPGLLSAWSDGQYFLYTPPEGAPIAIELGAEKDAAGTAAVTKISDGQPLVDPAGQPVRLKADQLTSVKTNIGIRRAIKGVLDVLELGATDPVKRLQAAKTVGYSQALEKLPLLEKRLEAETDPEVLKGVKEAVGLVKIKSPDDKVKLEGFQLLQELQTLGSYDLITAGLKQAETANNPELVAAATAALKSVDSHRSFVNFFGTIFRGTSLGSILLIASLGLAITFGLMGVINMAHGEMIAVGAYTTYVVQNVFGAGLALSPFGFSIMIPGMHATGAWYQTYFLFALPLSFIVAAGVGILLERGVIQFLYSRPLESLLATWGVSLVLQQLFRLTFGANNVQVSSPVYLSGNWTINDIVFNWNRVFVIGFAILIVFGVWLILTKTPLGLLIRAVMQNRNMAACMGVRTNRVNMMTFGLGSGLAGLAGAFLSQIGNVGPSLGQTYIVDCFMTVVVGGVGNLVGTVVSAVGIGLADQSIQQILLNPVMGKVLVLLAIILFLQWRPAGIFVTRSRSLD